MQSWYLALRSSYTLIKLVTYDFRADNQIYNYMQNTKRDIVKH